MRLTGQKREFRTRRRALGNRKMIVYAVFPPFPRALDPSADRKIVRTHAGQPFLAGRKIGRRPEIRTGAQNEARKTGAFGIGGNTGHISIHPLAP